MDQTVQIIRDKQGLLAGALNYIFESNYWNAKILQYLFKFTEGLSLSPPISISFTFLCLTYPLSIKTFVLNFPKIHNAQNSLVI